MSKLTLQALNVAIGSLAFEREALVLRIESVSAEVEREEQLSEQVLLMEQVLGEFREAYASSWTRLSKHPPYEAIVAEGARSARAAFGC